MNFNVNSAPEYNLYKSFTAEIINLYGIPVKYLITEKINQDIIFGEHSHIKIDNSSVYELYMLPGENDQWGGDNALFSKFGMQSLDSLTMFVSAESMEIIHPKITNKIGKGWDFIIGNLVVLPNNKIMEVSGFEHEVVGNNNLFTYNDKKNVYSIALKSYIANRDDYNLAKDITSSNDFEYEDFGNLESIFKGEESHKENITHRSQEKVIEDETIYPTSVRQKPIRDKTKEGSVFGDFG